MNVGTCPVFETSFECSNVCICPIYNTLFKCPVYECVHLSYLKYFVQMPSLWMWELVLSTILSSNAQFMNVGTYPIFDTFLKCKVNECGHFSCLRYYVQMLYLDCGHLPFLRSILCSNAQYMNVDTCPIFDTLLKCQVNEFGHLSRLRYFVQMFSLWM